MSSWVASGQLAPAGFHPTSCRVTSPGVYLCAGWCEPYDAPNAVLFRFTRESGVEELLREPGRIVDLDVSGDSVWALMAQNRTDDEGSDYFLLISPDGGENWLDCPQLEVESVSRVLCKGPREGWLLGSETLLRTADRGQRWEDVTAPGVRSGISERLASSGDATLLLSEDSVMSTRNGGGQWEILDLEGARACAVDGGGLLAVKEHKIKFGTVNKGKVMWIGTFDHDAEPFRLVVTAQGARFLALPNHPEEMPGILWFESEDRGASWDIQLIPGRVIEGAADLRADGGIMLSPQGDVFVLG